MSEIKVIVDKQNLPLQIDFKAGVLLLVDKDKDWTSFDVVNKTRYKIKHKLGVKKIKVGHAGTLDPMATGLLLICVGKYTKLIDQLQGLGKSYAATIKLGATTASYDAEEAENETYPTQHITEDLIEKALDQHRGDILQTPPMFSAIKVDGVRLYKHARKGKTIELKQRPVTIHQLEIVKLEMPYLDVNCAVSKGTYIRSLAHDIGQSVNSGGYLTQLRRTKVAHYDAANALTVDELVEWIDNVELISTEGA